ncbi:cytochrome b [Stenotrophobium rhamnosiphilum]|uniref:Cytochrome b n=1 Tax=Stenotrophobium rhamnosiphilum TaxID=2029166 RepID=A0A2T5MDU5_9GAMM|nr:cytochrome b [Stenotrophobium rhamnosiphilum]PTU30736.1 cytochrome b [Stenotrophobium rhamnosiphilum]
MQSYTGIAKTLHWLVFALMSGAFTVGFYMHDLPLSPSKLQLVSWHKWTGVTIFVLVLLRLTWRLMNPPPALPTHMSKLERGAAEGMHRVLYILMLAMPLSGWLMSSAKGIQTVWFGVIPLPDLLYKSPPLGKALSEVHEALGFIILAFVAVHVLAAFKHHFIDRDDVLARMVPGMKPRSK